MGKLIIFSAPSGSGKTTIVHSLLESYPNFEFSISATSRPKRGKEVDGVDYYFISDAEFKEKVSRNEFVEWEEVYAGTSYGTLRSEMERIWAKGNTVLFDVDVMGGINLKKKFGKDALAIFIMPPSIEELRSRLIKRGTDSMEVITKRVAKAQQEIAQSPNFDYVVINDNLEKAIDEVRQIIETFFQ